MNRVGDNHVSSLFNKRTALLASLALAAAAAILRVGNFELIDSSRLISTVERKSPIPMTEDVQEKMYSRVRNDGAGAVIQDMLYAHAFAFLHGRPYGGACGLDRPHMFQSHVSILTQIGLLDELPMFDKCKDEWEVTPDDVYRKGVEHKDEMLFSETWLHYIRSRITVDLSQTDQSQPETAVHIRRGDVGPCTTHGMRYLPNSHYQSILDNYIPASSHVTLYSQRNSFEPIAASFGQRCTLQLDVDLGQTWLGIMSADFVVMSKSSFSFVPTLLNAKATVIYTPFWDEKFHNWTQVNADIMNRTEEDGNVLRARANCRA
jgi:hypothetical protein